jgi:hypothetical protein
VTIPFSLFYLYLTPTTTTTHHFERKYQGGQRTLSLQTGNASRACQEKSTLHFAAEVLRSIRKETLNNAALLPPRKRFIMVPKADSHSTSTGSSPTKSKKASQTPLAETCPSFRRGHLPNDDDVERLRYLTRPHVESFNYFLETGLAKGIKALEPAELDLVDPKRIREEQLQGSKSAAAIDWDDVSTIQWWVEDVKVAKPTQSDRGRVNQRLLPHESRERSLMYSAEMMGKFCYQLVQRRNGVAIKGTVHKIPKSFGKLPIMVGSKACHLEGLSSKELVQLKEEVCCDVN